MKTNRDLFRFFQKCIRLRTQYGVFRRTDFFPESGVSPSEHPEIIWQSLTPDSQDWSDTSLQLGFLLNSVSGKQTDKPGFLILVNGSRSHAKTFTIPSVSGGTAQSSWLLIVDTAADSPLDFVAADQARRLSAGAGILVKPMALTVLQSRI
jgi:pullulanase/glycogen debranching enzyme